jgi:hypothetical protein
MGMTLLVKQCKEFCAGKSTPNDFGFRIVLDTAVNQFRLRQTQGLTLRLNNSKIMK